MAKKKNESKSSKKEVKTNESAKESRTKEKEQEKEVKTEKNQSKGKENNDEIIFKFFGFFDKYRMAIYGLVGGILLTSLPPQHITASPPHSQWYPRSFPRLLY